MRSKTLALTVGSVCFLGLALLAGEPARAEVCAVDTVPAATLLLPYFEVDLDAVDGVTTLLAIGSSSPGPVLARVTLWTDLAIPTVGFDVYLTGFDVQTLNLRDVFVFGALPGGEPPLDPGDLSAFNQEFPGCEFVGPLQIPAGPLLELQQAHLGESSLFFGGLCGGESHGDRKARGFVTVDVVERCDVLLPTDGGYFGEGGVAADDNVLWGDFFHVEPSESFAQGEALVRLEASAERFGPGDRTFYGFLVGGDGSDHREPLPRLWSTRYLSGGGFSGGTSIVAWRAPVAAVEPFECSGGPIGSLIVPTMRELFAFDEQESVVGLHPIGILDPPPPPIFVEPLPYAANRRNVLDLPFAPPFDFGWLAFDLRSLVDFAQPHPLSQAWLGAAFDASGRFSVGLSGTAHDDPCSLDGCLLGDRAAPGRLCVRGRADGFPATSELLEVGGFVRFQVFPAGCFSTSCTLRYGDYCSVDEREGNEWSLSAGFCLAENVPPGGGCTADCSGGGTASCTAAELEPGSFRAVLGELEIAFTVPSVLPVGGRCVDLP